MVFIDSNIWCFYFNQSSKEHEDVAKKINQVIDSEQRIHINNVILMEVGHFLIKNLGGVKGKKKLDQMLQHNFQITDLNYPLTKESLEILKKEHQTGIGGRDATIIATMKQEKIDKLITHDQSFKKIEHIDVIDPVK